MLPPKQDESGSMPGFSAFLYSMGHGLVPGIISQSPSLAKSLCSGFASPPLQPCHLHTAEASSVCGSFPGVVTVQGPSWGQGCSVTLWVKCFLGWIWCLVGSLPILVSLQAMQLSSPCPCGLSVPLG